MLSHMIRYGLEISFKKLMIYQCIVVYEIEMINKHV